MNILSRALVLLMAAGVLFSSQALGANAARLVTKANELVAEAEAATQRRDSGSAVRLLREALELYQKAGDSRGPMKVWAAMGTAHLVAIDYEAAAVDFNAMLTIANELNDLTAQAAALANLGITRRKQGRCVEALEVNDKARYLFSGPRSVGAYAQISAAMGECFVELGQLTEAERVITEGLNACLAIKSPQCLPLLYASRSSLRQRQGKLTLAFEDMTAGRAAKQPGVFESRIAIIHELSGRYFDALKAADEARQIMMSQGYNAEDGIALYDTLSRLHRVLGNEQQSDLYLQKALTAARALGNQSLLAKLLVTYGAQLHRQKQFAAALSQYNEAMKIDTRGPGHELAGIGAVAFDQDNQALALDAYQRALTAFRKSGDARGESTALTALGAVLNRMGKHEEARGVLLDAITSAKSSSAPGYQAKAELFRAFQGLGRHAVAIYYGKQAVDEIQALRQSVDQFDAATRTSFFDADKRRVYEELTLALLDSGRESEAGMVLVLLKSQEVVGFLHAESEDEPSTASNAPVDSLTPEESRLKERQSELETNLVKVSEQYRRLSNIPYTARTPAQKRQHAELQAKLDAAQTRYREALESVASVLQQAGRTDVTANELSDTEGLQATLERLGSGAVVLQYLITPHDLWILLTTPDVQIARKSPIASKDLRALVGAYRKILADSSADPMPAARRLYDVMIKPIAADLDAAHARTLMVSMDGVLNYLPLATLHDGQGWLIEKYALSVYLPAARDKLDQMRRGDWRVAGLGVSKALRGAAALPGVPRELHSIVKEGGATGGGVLPGRITLDEAFTDQALRDALQQRFPVVHIASHFGFTPGSGADSFLLLGDGNLLSLADFQRKAYRLSGVDLLTLSACQTAVGDDPTSGSEVEGLAVTLIRRGASSVIASLWSVNDASTALLMKNFYEMRQSSHLNKAEALRRAQLALIGRRPAAAGGAERGTSGRDTAAAPTNASPFAHPFYWAPFILLGNWQ